MAGETLTSTESLRHAIDTVFAKTSIQTKPERVTAARLTAHLPGFRVLDAKMLPPDVARHISKATESGRPLRVENDLDRHDDKGLFGLPARLVGRLLTSSAAKQEAQPSDDGDVLHIQCEDVRVHFRRYGDVIPLGQGLPQLPLMASQWSYSGQLKLDGEEILLDPDAKAASVTLRYPLYDNSKTDLTVVQTLYPYECDVETESIKHIGEYWERVPYRPFGGIYDSPETMMQRAFEALTVTGTEYQVVDVRRLMP